jgi:hypothetical protein
MRHEGNSSAGTHSHEELFTREFLCPAISRYFKSAIRNRLPLSDLEIEKGLGTEGFQNCPDFSFTPARQQPHFFTKSDIIKGKPPESWFKLSNAKLPRFQACPDFAIKDPLPFRAIGEVKFFKAPSKSKAISELYNATRQAVFYLGAFHKEYDNAILVFADATPNNVFRSAIKDLNEELIRRYGEETGIYLSVISLVK